MNKQFVIPSISMVPKHFLALAAFKTVAYNGSSMLTKTEYHNLTMQLRAGLVPSLRVCSNGGAKKKANGQVFVDPKFCTQRLMGKRVATLAEELVDLNLPLISFRGGNPAARAQVALLKENYPAVVTPTVAQRPLKFAEPAVEFVEAVEVKPQSALTDQTHLAERMVAGIEEVKDTNSEMLAAIRENTAVMTKLLAVWAPTA